MYQSLQGSRVSAGKPSVCDTHYTEDEDAHQTCMLDTGRERHLERMGHTHMRTCAHTLKAQSNWPTF